LVNCRFETKHVVIGKQVDYYCDSKGEDILNSGLCIFHDKNYLQDKDSEKNEQNVRSKLLAKVRGKVDKKEPLFCIGYYLPSIRINENFYQAGILL
jgi:hypothetical protein